MGFSQVVVIAELLWREFLYSIYVLQFEISLARAFDYLCIRFLRDL